MPIPGGRGEPGDEPGLVAALTLVVWVGCVAIGAAGLLSQPVPPMALPPASQPVMQVVNVMLQDDPQPPPPAPAPAAAPPAAVTPVASVALPVPTAALASTAIAFAVPVDRPARIAPAAEAVPVAARPPGPVVNRLTVGSTGGDRLPQPGYPSAADDAGQTGTVVVRFSVAADGRVTDAWIVKPCQWPLLNEEALRAARETPQPPGIARVDEYAPTWAPRSE
jgi:protein TonB